MATGQGRCYHHWVHAVDSPDDGGYYCECLECDATGPVCDAPYTAHRAFEKADRDGTLDRASVASG